MAKAIDLRGIDAIARALDETPEVGEKAVRLAMASGARRGLTMGVEAIYQRKALSKSYIRSNFDVKSRPAALELRIIANQRRTLFTRYGAQIRTVPATSDPRYLKGDPARGIPRGRKAAGAKGLRFNRGDAKQTFYYMFWVRIRGTGRWEPADRTGEGRNAYDVAHSMSVAQTWNYARDDVGPELMDYVASEFRRQFLRLS